MGKLKIVYQQPPEGRRRQICRGDEALVRRIHSGTHEGLVERVQVLGPLKSTGHDTSFALNTNQDHHFPSSLISYHILKFLSLGLARVVAPEHIVHVQELRFYRMHGKRYAAMYSEYVPDETGVIPRRLDTMKRFYEEPDKERRILIREREEQREFDFLSGSDINQTGLIQLLNFGFDIRHTTANYHVSHGRMVLFEVDSLNPIDSFYHGFSFLAHSGGQPACNTAMEYLAAIYSIVLKTWIYSNPTIGNMRYYPFCEMFKDVYSIFVSGGVWPAEFLNEASKVFSYPFYFPSNWFRNHLQHEPELPCTFDPAVMAYLNGYEGLVRKFNHMR